MVQELIWHEVPSIYLNPGPVSPRTLLCRWKKYQEWHSPGAHCTKSDFARATQFVGLFILLYEAVHKFKFLLFNSFMLVFIKVKLSHLPNFIYIRTEAKSYIKLPLLHDVLQVSGYIRTHISENYLLILSIMFPSREGEREFCVSLPPHKKSFSLCKQLVHFF